MEPNVPATPPVTAAPSADLVQALSGTVTGLTNTVTNVASALLLPCTQQTYVKVAQRVGPQGGTIRFGNHELVIPAGALNSSILITAEALPEAGNAVRFQPEGLKFASPAALHLSYANCRDNPVRIKLIVYTDDLLRILERLNTVDDKRDQEVVAPLRHFSRYAVAW